MQIGVLALQGAFREHRLMLESLGAHVCEVRRATDVAEVAGMVIPGGESTTVGKLLQDWGLLEPIRDAARAGMPVFGTCAGLVLLGQRVQGSQQLLLGLMDITVERNAYGRQVNSFEADLLVPAVGLPPVKAVFIRAPMITGLGSGVESLAAYEGNTVLARQNNLLVASFHPELTNDIRIHRYFLDMVKQAGEAT